MALIIVKRLIVVKKEEGQKKSSVSAELTEDTMAVRNTTLQSLGFENKTGKDPDLSKDSFTNSIKRMYPTIKSIRIDDCIKDTDTGKYYSTFELDDDKYVIDDFWLSPETKKKDTKNRKDEVDAS